MAKGKRTFWNFAVSLKGDKVVWMIALMLIMISIVCIFSSTSRLLDSGQTRVDIVRSQLVIVAMGLGLIVICYNIKDIRVFRWLAKWGFFISFALLVLLLSKINTPFLKSIELNGARRILQVAGFQVHVFEVVKVTMVLYLAWALDALKQDATKKPGEKTVLPVYLEPKYRKTVYIFAPFLISLIMVIPGSNSAALFIGGIMFIVILLGKTDVRELLILAAAAVVLVFCCWGIFEISGGKAMGRIGTAVNRVFDNTDWEKMAIDAKAGSKDFYDAIDHIRQPYGAKIAIKEGGLLGKGPGQSTQRYVVPDMSEDYMFSFIIEEYGLWGAAIVIFLYVSLLARSSIIARNCGKDEFAKLAVAGLSLLITGQAFLHMCVNADIGPMTGQTLPLISHGNSAFLCFSLAFGIILSISRIASDRIAREQKALEPLVDLHEEPVRNSLDDLDDFESGRMDEVMDENMQ